MGVNAPYLTGELIGGTRARAKKLRSASIAPLNPAAAPAYMNELAGELRRQTAGIGIDVINVAGGVVVRIPATLTFDSGSATIAPQVQGALHELARTLKTRSKTYVDVYAHSDSTGDARYNQSLSDKRAAAVASFLGSDGVARARIASKGFGETALLYIPDDTETKQAANRRVEIRLVPFTG